MPLSPADRFTLAMLAACVVYVFVLAAASGLIEREKRGATPCTEARP